MSNTKIRRTKAEQSEATRGHLIGTARALFAQRGYGGVGTEEIVQRAHVTRGALYHHFPDKERLFEAVVEAVMRDLHGLLMRAAVKAKSDPWRGLVLGIAEFLRASRRVEILRIALLDAPSVLGWARWRELDARYGLGLL
jgi:AcrR family transcriptional regulator